jgi:hypothetical protein
MTEAEVLELQGRRAAASFGKANQFEIRGQRAVGGAVMLNSKIRCLSTPAGTIPVSTLLGISRSS